MFTPYEIWYFGHVFEFEFCFILVNLTVENLVPVPARAQVILIDTERPL